MKNDEVKSNIVVIGGTGLIGSKVVAGIKRRGLEAVAASPNTGVDTLTGKGLAEVLERASVVVDVSNSPSFEDAAVMEFFTRSTGNLIKYEKEAGVKHHVVLSVVGAERLADSGGGYLRAKLAQERLVKESSIPFTIIRATQFFEFSRAIADAATDKDNVHLAPVPYQPIAADDVAEAVEDVAAGPPLSRTIEIAGPEVFRFDKFIDMALDALNDPRKVVADPEAPYFGAHLSENTLVPGNNAHLAKTRFDEWISAQSRTVSQQTAKGAGAE